MRDDCIFCRIISKQLPSKIVYEDDTVMAFLDIDPVSEGHTLVVPKIHSFNIEDIDPEILKNVTIVTQRISKKIFEVLTADGVNVLQNNREAASQVIPHFHMHIIPRRSDDGIRILYSQSNSDKDLFSLLDKTLEKIKITK